jgi:hypothetical protein
MYVRGLSNRVQKAIVKKQKSPAGCGADENGVEVDRGSAKNAEVDWPVTNRLYHLRK